VTDDDNSSFAITSESTALYDEFDNASTQMAATMRGFLDEAAEHPEIQRVRAVANELMDLKPGHRVLDAGSGLGEAARQLAAHVSPEGEVVALDRSADLVGEARRRHDGSAVQYVNGDVTALELPDDHFDRARIERVLQHLDDPDRAIAELVRVTRPGGRVCLIDTDWESLAIDGVDADLVRAVKRGFAAKGPAMDTGRTLRRRLRSAGAVDVAAVPVTCYFPNLNDAVRVVPIVEPASPINDVLIPVDLRGQWNDSLTAAESAGDFLAVLTIWVVAGAV
jgi:SAM-dependent methyltransferase